MRQRIDIKQIDPRIGSSGVKSVSSQHIAQRNQSNVTDVVKKKRLGEQIISRIETLPALPTVVTQLMRLIDDDRSSAKNLETFLRQDQALTARLLKIVNSSFFGLRNKISSIPQAIVIIGFNSLKNLVLAASTSKLFQGACPAYGYQENGLWMHSFMSAEWSKQIAIKTGIKPQEAEDLFVAGLLHDVGKLILANYVNADCKEMIAKLMENNGDLLATEDAIFGIDHAEIGSKVAQKWNFSKKLASIIGDHERPNSGSMYFHETAVVHLADYLLASGQYGMYNNFPIQYNINPEVLKVLKMTDEELQALGQSVAESAEKWDPNLCMT